MGDGKIFVIPVGTAHTVFSLNDPIEDNRSEADS
jgi:hypothetical protein